MSEDVPLDPDTQRRAVRERYAAIATDAGDSDCCTDVEGCCESAPETVASELGYGSEALAAVPEGANLGLGCGNPTAIADLEPGETVLDLGSGAGFDCFLAAREVGDTGRVLGVDMTPEMVEQARENADPGDPVEFRLGEIEHLPVADATVDVVISNCVVNLSPDKPQVFREARRVLQPGGRLAISDVVLTADIPPELRADPDSVAACVGGAEPMDDLETMVREAGFVDVAVEPKVDAASVIEEWDDDHDLSEFLVSARIRGRKPADA